MALASGSIFHVTSAATTGNVNGAGFNPANANFPTDLATTSGTSTTPSLTSASYSFVAGDVGAWIYVKSGTSWKAGWYQITSVAGGAATVNAAIGASIATINAQGTVTYNTTAGVGTTATLSGGTYGVDFSQQSTADSSITDAASVGSSTTLTSASAPWKRVSVGNFFHLATTGTGGFGVIGWYEIVNYSSASSVTTDRTTNSGTALAAGTGKTGGAGNLNGLEDAFQAMIPSAGTVFVQNGTYTLSGSISTNSGNASATNPVFWVGFNSKRGDACNGSNRPLIACGANTVTASQFHIYNNFSATGTGTTVLARSQGAQYINCKVLNSSTTSNRNGFSAGLNNDNLVQYIGCESTSQNGYGVFSSGNGGLGIYGCYVHDSVINYNNTNASSFFVNNISESSSSNGLVSPGGSNFNDSMIIGSTFYGRKAITGTGISFSTSNSGEITIANNIITGFTTGLNNTTGPGNSNISIYNDFYNNTTDVTFFLKSSSDLALNPTFSNQNEVVGTVGQGIGSSNFQDSTQNFTTAGVVANQDFLHITSGGSLTAGCYLITAISTTTNPNDTLTLNNSPGTGAASAVYWITTGHNLTPTNASLVGAGYPNFTNASNGNITSYPTIGAIQQQQSAGGGGGMIQSRVFTGF